MADTYASVRNGFVIAFAVCDRDETAQQWYRDLPWRNRDRAALAVLDLAKGETVELGVRVALDADGVATLERLAS